MVRDKVQAFSFKKAKMKKPLLQRGAPAPPDFSFSSPRLDPEKRRVVRRGELELHLAVAVDGGKDYLKRSGNLEDMIEMYESDIKKE